jgi:predicted nuclease of predicted toxin-antitoxin system
MKFLVDADLPRGAALLLRRRGHTAVDVRDVGLGSAGDGEIAAYARGNGLCILTGDFGFADVRNYPTDQNAGIVVLQVPRNGTAATIMGILDSLLRRPDLLAEIPGRLARAAMGSVRLRPSPHADRET